MTTLIFEAADVRRVVEHSIKQADNQSEYLASFTVKGGAKYAKPDAPAVTLVHDDGIYLMSNGAKRDLISGTDKPGEGKSFVAYARGCDPSKGDVWDHCRDLVGGDDFSECLPWARQMLDACNKGATIIRVDLRGNQISFDYKLPTRPAAKLA